MPIGSVSQFSATGLTPLSESLENIALDDEKENWVEVSIPNTRRPHALDMRTVTERELIEQADAQKLHALIKKGDYQLVDYMLKTHGPHLVNIKNKDGMTALYVAISGSCIPNRKEVIDTLMDFNPNVNERTKNGDTPVKAAVEFGRHHSIIKDLISAGANLDQVGRHHSIIKDLISAGANLDQEGAKGMSARQAFEISKRESLKPLFR